MVDGCSRGKDGKRCSVRARGPSSGGRFAWAVRHLRSPYLAHLDPPYFYGHPHLHATIFFLFHSRHSLPSSQRRLSFLIQRINILTCFVFFSLYASISGVPVSLSLRYQSSFIPKSLVFLSTLHIYAIYHQECIPNISILSMMLYQYNTLVRSFTYVSVYTQ